MRVAFDTSVLVAGLVAGHAHEQRARVWLDAARAGGVQGLTTTHALAELWATLTALPIEPRVEPARITELVERVRQHLVLLELETSDYNLAMHRCSERGFRSGAVYDALHLVAAERAQADLLLTFNTKHFVALSVDAGPRVLAPPDPPSLLT